MDIDDINRMSLSELTRFVAELSRRMSGIVSQPTAAEVDAFARLTVLERAEVLHSRAIRLHDETLKYQRDWLKTLAMFPSRLTAVEEAIVSLTQTLEAMQKLLERAWDTRRRDDA